MARQWRLFLATVTLAIMALAGCTSDSSPAGAGESRDDGAPERMFVVEVHRSPGCGCCHEWEAYLREHGYEVHAADDPEIASFKSSLGVPAMSQSCHTALIDGYVIEGHVPIAAIQDLLRERPAIDGIALPGMPPGSPGMSGTRQGPLEVISFNDGNVSAFGGY